MKLSTKDRQKAIMNYLITHEFATVNQLAEMHDVTTETIRKDLTTLEEQKKIDKGHGTVKIANTYYENPFNIKELLHVEEKIKIAEYAIHLISDNQVIYLDASTTSIQLAKMLSISERKNLTVITNSIDIARVLTSSSHQLLVLGGEMRMRSQAIVGAWALQAATSFRADIAFMGCDGFSAKGATNRSYKEIELKQEIVKNARLTYLLADTSKFTQETTFTFVDYETIAGIITNRLPENLGNVPVSVPIIATKERK
ncbi:MAG: DeoR/GlpR family DNA-binding transcription regulator [Lactobacillales bacterium]|nr:DeoR/GlpR family DNA-binding transcription regulator [Lactobacillales bacterium]